MSQYNSLRIKVFVGIYRTKKLIKNIKISGILFLVFCFGAGTYFNNAIIGWIVNQYYNLSIKIEGPMPSNPWDCTPVPDRCYYTTIG